MPERLLGESLEGRDPKERALTEPDEGQAMPEQLLGEPLEGWNPEERPPDRCPRCFIW